jgi:hypothetical protein
VLLLALLLAAAPGGAVAPVPMGGPAPAPAVSPAGDAKVGAVAEVAPGAVVLKGLDSSTVLTAAAIAAAPHEHVAMAAHGGPAVDYSGPLLSDLLRQAGAPLGVRLHGAGVNDVVFVTGSDRFRAVFSLAELDPSFHTGAKVILADQADGKPLDPKIGPYRLVIDGDQRPARSVHSVVMIEVKHLP